MNGKPGAGRSIVLATITSIVFLSPMAAAGGDAIETTELALGTGASCGEAELDLQTRLLAETGCSFDRLGFVDQVLKTPCALCADGSWQVEGALRFSCDRTGPPSPCQGPLLETSQATAKGATCGAAEQVLYDLLISTISCDGSDPLCFVDLVLASECQMTSSDPKIWQVDGSLRYRCQNCVCDPTTYQTSLAYGAGSSCTAAESNLLTEVREEANANCSDGLCSEQLIVTSSCYFDGNQYRTDGYLSYSCKVCG